MKISIFTFTCNATVKVEQGISVTVLAMRNSYAEIRAPINLVVQVVNEKGKHHASSCLMLTENFIDKRSWCRRMVIVDLK